jgi:hypothetical protein
LGRAGAARPSPPAPPVAPPGLPARASASATTTHRGRAPAEDASQVAGAATSRCSLLPCPPRSRRDGRAARLAWPAWSLRRQARPPRPAPNPAARVSHRPATDQRDLGSVARVPASASVDRAVDGPAATGPPPVPVVTVARPLRLGPHRHRLSMGGDGRVRTDRGRHQTPGHRTGGQQTPGHRTARQQTAPPPDPLDDHPR